MAGVFLMPFDNKDTCGLWPLSYDDPDFLSACSVHDASYVNKELRRQTMSRKEADKWFLRNMLSKVDSESSRLKKVTMRGRAYVYYGLARVVGGLVW
jgi:hypothetical protein